MMLHTFNRPRPKIIVVSHERSGTHFLMNSIARCYGYVVTPWLNFDYELGLNFFDPRVIAQFFAQFRNQHLANIVKIHHTFPFFEEALDSIVQDFHILYIHRDPRDTLVSYWKFLNSLPWHEGPKCARVTDLLRAEPAGQMLRYQARQEPTVVHRWRSHVEGWTTGVPAALAHRVTYVRFDDLSLNYDETLKSFAPIFGEPPSSLTRPAVGENSILPNSGRSGAYRDYFGPGDEQWVDDIAGPLMRRLGYASDAAAAAGPALALA
jgi:hypothetical protein